MVRGGKAFIFGEVFGSNGGLGVSKAEELSKNGGRGVVGGGWGHSRDAQAVGIRKGS